MRRAVVRWVSVWGCAAIAVSTALAAAAATLRSDAERERLVPLPLSAVQVGGEFGRRNTQIVHSDILQVEVDQTFLDQFRQRPSEPFPYLGFGKFLDAVVRLAAHQSDPQLLALKKQLVRELLATQDPDSYISWVRDPGQRIHQLWDLHRIRI